jgi:hypothetical protein
MGECVGSMNGVKKSGTERKLEKAERKKKRFFCRVKAKKFQICSKKLREKKKDSLLTNCVALKGFAWL